MLFSLFIFKDIHIFIQQILIQIYIINFANAYNNISKSKMSHQKQSEQKQNQDNNSEDQFEVLDSTKANLAVEYKNKAKQFLEKAIQQQKKIETNLSQQAQIINDGKLESEKCLNCIQLKQQVEILTADRDKACEDLRIMSIELLELKKKMNEKKQTTVDKGQLEYAKTSLKQMIRSYEQEDERLKSFILKTMNITGSPSKKSLAQTVQNVVTDFMFNWQQLDRELNNLQAVSSPSGQAVEAKVEKGSYNYFATVAKIGRIKENIMNLKKGNQ